MKHLNAFLLSFSALALLFSCQDEKPQFEFAGGTLTMCIDNEPSTYVPKEVTDVYSNTVLTQTNECLISFNPEDLSIQPQLATKWNISNDGRVFSFDLRKDVLFHNHEVFDNDDERLMTPEDVLYSFESACKPTKKGEPTSAYLGLFADQVKGAKEYYEGKAKNVAGFKIKGNSFEITLIQSDPTYINKLAQINAAVVSKKVAEAGKEADCVGTGPFVFSEYKQGDQPKIILTKNEDYYLTDNKGNALPYLDSVVFIVETRKLEQLDLFEQGKTQIIKSLPTSRITQMLEGRIKDFNSEPPLMVLYNNPLLYTNYYFFNMTEERFKDPRVRQAFNFAIDRDRITQEVLRGQFHENGIYGMVPPIGSAFRGYDFKGVREVSYNYNPEKAKQLLAEAGYPGGKGFGSVNLRINFGDINSAVAEDLCQQIYQNLGIVVNIDGSTFEQRDNDADYAKGDLFRAAWVADFSSPETFLVNFYGKLIPKSMAEASQINQARYNNPVFDSYFEQARSASTQKKRFELYSQAEKELMKDPPVMILWYSNDFQLSYSKVRNLKDNPMNILDLKQVYFKEWTKEEYLKSVQ